MHRIVNHPRRLLYAAALVLIPVAALATMAGTSSAFGQAEESGPLSCEIRIAPQANGLEITAQAHALQEISGTYQLQVTSRSGAGGASLHQGGAFTASPQHPAELGAVSLGSGGGYAIALDINADGHHVRCDRGLGNTL
ncbi:hypothetical protein NAC44_05775 [Allorhizobium sp. BGMRC 0089]|nr:hypothetical protein [Allorhizobium sonneratiae]